jgi:long-subunit fatty acid transport protein
MARLRLPVLALTVCLAVTLEQVAFAGVEDTFALGPGPMALAGSYGARPGDFAAAYYNPAGLAPGGAVVEKGGFFEASFSLVYGHPSLFVTGSRGQPLSTPSVPDTAGAVVGTRFSLGPLFHINGLDMGLALYVPSHIFQWSIRPDDTLQWALLTDRTQVFTANLAAGYRVCRGFSLGAGVRVAFDAETNITGVLTHFNPMNDQATAQIGTNSTVYGRAAPVVGVLFTPVDRLRVGATFRGESYIDDWGTTVVATGPQVGLGNLGYDFRFAHYFEPNEVAFSASADVSAAVSVSADVTYGEWSQALSTNRNTYGCGLSPCDGTSPIWGDTWTPAFGAKWQATRALALMAGYRFQKSPIDNFGGPSNLLDADRHVPSTGLELDLSKIVPWLDAKVKMGLQYVILVDRTETKDFERFSSDAALEANPGYPSYSYGGHIVAGSLGVDGRW